MNSNNDNAKLIVLAVLVLVGVALLGYVYFLEPLAGYNREIEGLEASTAAKATQIATVIRDRKKLEVWRALSLPGLETPPKDKDKDKPKIVGPSRTPEQARQHAIEASHDKYGKWLRDLLDKHRIQNTDPVKRPVDMKATPHQVNGQPVYVSLPFSINIPQVHYQNLVKMLRDFSAAPLLHRVRSLTIKTLDASAKAPQDVVSAKIEVEALILNGAARRGDHAVALAQPLKELAALQTALMPLRARLPGSTALPWLAIHAHTIAAKQPEDKHYDEKSPVVQGLLALYATTVLSDRVGKTKGTDRRLADIATKNIFEGKLPDAPKPPKDTRLVGPVLPDPDPPPPVPAARATKDLLTFVYLTDITIPGKMPARATLFYRTDESLRPLCVEEGKCFIPLVASYEYSPGTNDGLVVKGQVLRIEPRGVFFRVGLHVMPPEEDLKVRFKNAKVIYSLAKEDVDELVKAGAIKATEADRTFKMQTSFWEGMKRDKVVTVAEKGKAKVGKGPTKAPPRPPAKNKGKETDAGKDFAFRWDLVQGKVVRADDKWVVIRLPEKYASFNGDPEYESLEPHTGYCYYYIGSSLMDALETSLAGRELQEFLAAAPKKE